MFIFVIFFIVLLILMSAIFCTSPLCMKCFCGVILIDGQLEF